MKFKTILYPLLVFALLGFVVMGGFSLLQKASDLKGPPEQEEEKSARIDGVVINNLNQSNINGEILLYMNGADQAQVSRFKLDSSREKLHAKLTGSFNEFHVPGRIVAYKEDIYWIRYKQNNDEVVKISVGLDGQSEEVLYRSPAGLRLVGLNVVSEKEIYFTQYLLKEPTLYSFEIKTIKNEANATKVYASEGTNPVIMAGKNSKSQLIYKTFSVEFGRVENECSIVDKDKLVIIGCYNIKGTQYAFDSVKPSGSEYIAGQKGYIDRVDSKGKKVRILEGEVDEHFESIMYTDGFVYFVSGLLEEALFVPLSIERITIEGKNREMLATLPASNSATIAVIEDEFLIANISIKQSDKFEVVPDNLWIVNLQNKEMEQLTDIQCEGAGFCEAKYLGNY